MNESKFAKGEIVKLKSGGPEMTVDRIHTNIYDQFSGKYSCKWFSGDELQEGDFDEETLEKASAE
jgi:uncharacterized protein YodC (DUF2158 family)